VRGLSSASQTTRLSIRAFQLVDLCLEGGSENLQPIGRAIKVQLLGRRNEVFKLTKSHCSMPLHHDWKLTGIVTLSPREKSSNEITKNSPSIAGFGFARLVIFIAHNKYHDYLQILTAVGTATVGN
jgi:hypothetical protein